MKQRCAVGVDVGGTKIAAELVDLVTGKSLATQSVATAAQDGGQAVLDRVAKLVQDLRSKARALDQTPVGVGIGLPELVTCEGQVASAWNFDWRGIDLGIGLGLDLPLMVDSDVRCGALGEQRFGAAQTYATFSYVSIGTGISAVQCIDRRIHRGANGFAIHFGSTDLMPVGVDGPKAFNLEAFASGAGLSTVYAARTGIAGVTARDMIEGRAGPAGLELMDHSTTALASFLGQMINMIDPEALIIGGGLGTSAPYLRQLQAKIPSYVWAETCRGIPILSSALGPRAGAVGAACLLGQGQAG